MNACGWMVVWRNLCANFYDGIKQTDKRDKGKKKRK
jgi:1,4-dihydroxy-2-naphthoate octaprenyltransferase